MTKIKTYVLYSLFLANMANISARIAQNLSEQTEQYANKQILYLNMLTDIMFNLFPSILLLECYASLPSANGQFFSMPTILMFILTLPVYNSSTWFVFQASVNFYVFLWMILFLKNVNYTFHCSYKFFLFYIPFIHRISWGRNKINLKGQFFSDLMYFPHFFSK